MPENWLVSNFESEKMKNKKISVTIAIAVLIVASFVSLTNLEVKAQPDPTLDPTTIPKYVDQLVIPPVYVPKNIYDRCGNLVRQEYKISMTEFYQQILPSGYPMTKVWGYGGYAKDAVTGKYLGFVRNSPAPTFEAIKGVPVQVKWTNYIQQSMFAVDPTLHWANPNDMPMMLDPPYPDYPPGFEEAQAPVPLIPHLHGAEDQSTSDGGPEAWFTANGIHGDDYNTVRPTSDNSAVFYYPNEQSATTLWYHDHALGMTRLNVMSGLAGFYLLRDYKKYSDYVAPRLPKGKYEIPIAIQDRAFNEDGSMWFPSEGNNPDDHPYWTPEFFGNTIMVNGKLWPNLNVDRGQYRFRILDGSNARFYNFSLSIVGTDKTLPFTMIGTEGGYLKSAAKLDWLVVAPGERVDILVDFSCLRPGTKVIMTNNAAAPYPDGDPTNPFGDPTNPLFAETVGQIMQFKVGRRYGFRARWLPNTLNPTLKGEYPTLGEPDNTRTLPYFEEMSAIDEPLGVFLNGQKWDAPTTELPQVGSTEDWYLVNPTGDTHPIHLHLTMFQLLYRQPFDAEAYTADWIALNGEPPLPLDQIPTELDVTSYLTGPPEYPVAFEKGWKDTIQTPPGYVTMIRVRWAPQESPVNGRCAPEPGDNLYPFDPTVGPGYVWHCHIIDHEDNEMMRRTQVVP
jgi:spore coat protein A